MGEEAEEDILRAISYGDEDYGDPIPPPAAKGSVMGDNNPPTVKEQIRIDHADLLQEVEGLKVLAGKVPLKLAGPEDLETAAGFVGKAREVLKKITKTHERVKAPYKEGADAADEIFLTRGAKGTIEALLKTVQTTTDAYQAQVEEARRKELLKQAEDAAAAAAERQEEAVALEDAGQHRVAEVVLAQAGAAEDMATTAAAAAAAPVKDLVRTTTYSGVTVGGKKKWFGDITDAAAIDLNALRDVIQPHELAQFVNRFVDRGGRELKGVKIEERTVSTFR